MTLTLRSLFQTAATAGLAFALAAPLVSPLAAQSQTDVNRVDAATQVFREIQAVPDRSIPDSVLSSARCIAIIPGEKKFALGFGGSYGKGVVSCRQDDGRWGAPMFLSLAGGSWGAQIGGESSDIVMVFRSQQGLESMLSSKFRIGAGASAAAGPVGRNAAAGTDLKLNAEILTYARSKGAFAGIDLNGALLQPDQDANQRMYHTADAQQLLHGNVPTPTWGQALVHELDRFSYQQGQ